MHLIAAFTKESHALFLAGLHELREGRPFEAHEEWELLWKDSKGDEKLFLQGLIQLAAGLVHLGRGNEAPARRLFSLALAKLSLYPSGYAGLPVGEVCRRLREGETTFTL